MAKALNSMGVPAFRGGKWYAATVRRLLVRLGPEFQRQVWNHTARALSQDFGTKNDSAVDSNGVI